MAKSIINKIPKFEEFLYPFLLQLKDQDVTKKDMKKLLVSYFNLSDEQCSIKTKGGKLSQVDDRIGWARQYFKRALFIDYPQRGVYRITSRGLQFLKSHKSLSVKDLLSYKEFEEFSSLSVDKSIQNSNMDMVEDYTPTEQMEQAFQSINNDLVQDVLDKVKSCSPAFFEKLVAQLLVKMGYGGFNGSARVTQYSHDDGIDGIISEDKLGFDKIYIQAKRFTESTVGKPAIQQFVGALEEFNSTKGVFITTSKFSKEAINYVERTKKRIILIDGQLLAQYMIEYNVGVSVKDVYEIKKIDSDYFEDND